MKSINHLSISLLLFFPLIAIAEYVSTTTARQVAKNICIERYIGDSESTEFKNIFYESVDTDTLFYIFNLKSPQTGFVIVSAEDKTIPVLGYSFNNVYNPNDIPPQLAVMLSNFSQQIIYAKKTKILPAEKIKEEWNRLKKSSKDFNKSKDITEVPPLIQSQWHQYSPYNELCPSGSLVGCVAIAMGQTMKYWGHPIQGEGSHTYYHYNYGNLSADFGSTTYDWANIPHSTSTSNIPVATLLYHCGVAVEMNYSPSGSGSLLDGYHGAENAFRNYFKYDNELFYAQKYQYEDTTWRNMILNDLHNDRPIIYGGWNDFTWAGHAWNLDGYEMVGDLYHYHMNWGWNGSYNGYYYLDDLTPGSNDLNSGQEAIFNLYPYAANYITVYPQNTNYWTGTTNSTSKTQTSLIEAANPEDGWMMFDISAIPDGATIYSATFNAYVFERDNPNWSITPVTNDPLTSSASDLHLDIVSEQSSGYYYHRDETNINYPIGWDKHLLEGNAEADIISSLATDQFAVGIANIATNTYRDIRFDGWNELNPPYLNIYYTAYGNLEGTVTESGTSTPVENAIITIRELKDTTDASGYYFIPNVPFGDYEVFVEANGNVHNSSNPLFDQTVESITILDGITTNLDIGLKWAEIVLIPTSLNIPINPLEIKQESFTITNNGTGDLDYFCNPAPQLGTLLTGWDMQAASGQSNLYGCACDGTYIWVTVPIGSYADHQLYKMDTDGNLIQTYSQGTTSSWGMRKLTFDGTYLYGGDVAGFYRIDPNDGSVVTLFTDLPEGLYGITSLAWIPDLGFCAGYQDEDLFVFDESGNLIERLTSPGIYISDLTYDSINNCLWIARNSYNTIYQYNIDTQQLTGLEHNPPVFPNCTSQSLTAIFFNTDIIEGKASLCGMTFGFPIKNFFAFELETWIQVTNNKIGIVSGSSKASMDVDIELNPGEMTVPSKSAEIIITHTAGANRMLPVTITNNFTHGDIEGTIYRYGTNDPIENATVSINGFSDVSDINGNYAIVNVPIGSYDMIISSPDYLDDTLTNIPISGITKQKNFYLKWTEIDVQPGSFNANLSPDNTLETSFTISNSGTGDLIYNCEITDPGKSKSPNILVVDRDMSCTNNYEENFSDEWVYYQNALDYGGFSYTYYEVYTTWHSGPNLETMQQYDIIIWITGEAYAEYGMVALDELNLASYLDGGGSLLLSSQTYLSTFGWGNVNFSLGEFPHDYLGIETVNMGIWNIWMTGEMEGLPGSCADGYSCELENNYWMMDLQLTEITDHLGTDLFNVTDPAPEGICAIQYEGNGFKSIYTSASLATIEDGLIRANVLADMIGYFEDQWLFITSNQTGTVSGVSKGSIDVGLLFNATGLAEGTYNANLIVNSNDPIPQITVPVTLNVGDLPGVNLKVFLEGPFNGIDMDTDINQKNLIPISQPYDTSPWNYAGTESVVSIPNNQVVDWILVEYRDATDAASANSSTRIERQAAFLLSNGSVVGIDGYSSIPINSTILENLFIIICHRNHLNIMSANPVVLTGGTFDYDFTTDASKVYGGSTAHKEIASGIWGAMSGNGLFDNSINAFDKTNCWMIEAGLEGYLFGDYNMDCNVDNKDKDDFWLPNDGKVSPVP